MLVNTSEQPVEWSVWEVAQIDDPARACLPFHAGGRFPAGYLPFADNPPAPDRLQVGEAEVCLRRHPNRGSKIGGDSPAGWVAGVVGDLRFQVSARHEGGREYPDGGCSLEIWSNPDPLRYMELEVLSPIRKVQPRKSTAFTTRWNLSRLK